MTSSNPVAPSQPARMFATLHRLHGKAAFLAERLVAHDLLSLFMRITIAGVFWRSFLTKVETFGVWRYVEVINDFEIEKFHIRLPELPLEMKATTLAQFRGDFTLPLLPAELAAWMATLGEFILPILLVIGLFTRFAAAGLLVMTLVIQIFVFPDAWWASHALWAAMLLFIIGRGPGRLSLDHLLGAVLTKPGMAK
ncbi:MAG: DoxX family protein [Oceanicaulis sp.]|uniref:DoxX family protein n=1 Tax=Glycocaulis sp. TaxID=1969725 RepID=UPI0025BFB2A4|nr:DoxX family protein [Glycocaulis sp.]MCC5982027.1 DoxX family protein [Oceanicaulis sp.]MCH8521436.1 DoxX family protein [Glycocaulis sp.]